MPAPVAEPAAVGVSVIAPPSDDEDDPNAQPGVTGRLLSESPSWLVSLAMHFIVLVILALWSLPQLPDVTAALMFEAGSDDLDDFEEVPDVMFDQLEMEEVEFEMQPETDVVSEVVELSEFTDATEAPSFSNPLEVTSFEAPSISTQDLGGVAGEGTTGRGRAARTSLIRKHGGSQASEQAVADALNWFAQHQNPDGSWSLVHNRHKCNGRCDHACSTRPRPGRDNYTDTLRSATGLALLPFLGAGQTHKQGQHRRVVDRGLKALVALGAREEGEPGLSWRDRGNMYAHGIAAIALCEAYGMTRDRSLREPAQAAVDYIVAAQHPAGGWRYQPRASGDTSVTGWQVMALKSAYLAQLNVPTPVITKAVEFLDRMQHDEGARYAYARETNVDGLRRPSITMTSVGLLCRMYTGWDRTQPALNRGVGLLASRPPSPNNYYYNYYAAQVLFQHTGGRGREWRTFNRALRDQLVARQTKTGHAKGSWYVDGPHSDLGGRVYLTSLATMTLEVYYRYLPIYGSDAVEKEF